MATPLMAYRAGEAVRVRMAAPVFTIATRRMAMVSRQLLMFKVTRCYCLMSAVSPCARLQALRVRQQNARYARHSAAAIRQAKHA